MFEQSKRAGAFPAKMKLKLQVKLVNVTNVTDVVSMHLVRSSWSSKSFGNFVFFM